MNIREKLQNGSGRRIATIFLPAMAATVFWLQWPSDSASRDNFLSGLQKVAFVSGAFAVTAYNLRTRVIDIALKVDGKPARIEEFCRIARNCGKRLTNLVVLFTFTSAYLAALTLFKEAASSTRLIAAGAVALFAASVVSFGYIVFAFERLERFALDEAETVARKKEADRLFKINV